MHTGTGFSNGQMHTGTGSVLVTANNVNIATLRLVIRKSSLDRHACSHRYGDADDRIEY